MKRKLELVDLLVTIGMVATVFGGYMFYQASYGGTVPVMTPSQTTTNPPIQLMVQSMLQPEIGQAIVNQATLDRQFATNVSRDARNLYRASLAAEHHPINGLDTIEARATRFQANHAAQVQYVMGKTIVNLTGQGMRSDALSADNLSNKFNDRIITTAKGMGDFMAATFTKSWQPRLGEWIIGAANKERRFAGHTQERIGQGIVDLATTQREYLFKSANTQNQLHTLTAAAARTETQPKQFSFVGRGDGNLQKALGVQSIPSIDVGTREALPEIPFSYMFVAFIGLAIVFYMGCTLPRGRDKPTEDLFERVEKVRQEIYRKTA